MKHKTTLVDHLRSSAGVGRWTTAMHEAADLIEAQAAQIEMMKSVLSAISKCAVVEDCRLLAVNTLSATPNEALQAFAAKVREQCAQSCEAEYPYTIFHTDQRAATNCATAIRAIKELPK